VATDLLDLAARVIADGDIETRVNRVTQELSEVAEGIAVVESFSHVWAVRTDDGLALFDVSLAAFAAQVLTALRSWSNDRVSTVVYTHGHIDHVGGAPTVVAEAEERGDPRPRFVGHENVAHRFERYDLTNGWNGIINARQFAPARRLGMGQPAFFSDWVHPDEVFRDSLAIEVGGVEIELHHDKGETDDHAWAWLPERRAVLAGDFLTWVFPNAGNPQKVQRYPLEWARALRRMADLEPELLLPAHGLPIGGKELVAAVLDDVASTLEALVEQTLVLMNDGARLDTVVHAVKVPPEALEKPYLRPIYDEPEFVIRNIWRLYGGWYDGNPAMLKPAPDVAVADELAARSASTSAPPAMAALAEPESRRVHEVRADVYGRRRASELSLMAKGIYGEAAETSRAAVEGEG
jgi:glyoxylase-like metal-dependent hydrolase (beta-lactamase superfamily II)